MSSTNITTTNTIDENNINNNNNNNRQPSGKHKITTPYYSTVNADDTNMSPELPVHILCVPYINEPGFAPIEKNRKWLRNFEDGTRNTEQRYSSLKRITNNQDYKRLTDMLMEIHDNALIDYFHTSDYPPKPLRQSIEDYIQSFLKSRNLNSYYTYTTYMRVSVDLDLEEDISDKDIPKEQHNHLKEEYLIIPLYIRLKEFKDFDQMKVIEYVKKTPSNPDGYVVKPVNRKFFRRDPPTIKPVVKVPEPLMRFKDIEEEELSDGGDI